MTNLGIAQLHYVLGGEARSGSCFCAISCSDYDDNKTTFVLVVPGLQILCARPYHLPQDANLSHFQCQFSLHLRSQAFTLYFLP